jgi:tetratricopeptide (TPR) repeat protein
MYAEYLIFEQRLASAIPVLSDLAAVEPMMGLQAAALARRLGKTEEARLYAAKTLERVEEMLKDDPTNGYLAMNIARNQIFLDRHSDAIRTLRDSLKLVQTDDERQLLSQAIGDAIVAYVNYIEQSPTDTVSERLRVLRMLEAAVQIAPNNPRVVTMVADHVLGNMNAEDRQLAAVREALIKGSPAGIAHFIKGTAALMNEDHDLAELHLEKAAEQLPRSAAILNNLAVALAMRPEPDYERALKVSNQAITQVLNPTPHFYETRGQILYRMERFREAISDLERALAAPSLAADAHALLATCYEQVGDTELAEGHREQAAELKAKQKQESEQPASLPRKKIAGEAAESDSDADDAAAPTPQPSDSPSPSELPGTAD